MDAKIKQIWIDALRSGKYKQTKGTLKRKVAGKHRYCCLGVLEDVCELKSRKRRTLSNNVLNVLGLKSYDADTLASKNDSGECDFKEIADYIEVHVK